MKKTDEKRYVSLAVHVYNVNGQEFDALMSKAPKS